MAEPSTAQRWIDEVDQAEKDDRYTRWLKRSRIINRRYREERFLNTVSPVVYNRRYAMLWANVDTLSPAVYGKTPTAVVSRRFKDEDSVGRMASEVLERAVNYSLEEGRFDALMKLSVKDYLLPGRAIAWIRYVPVYGPFRVPVQITDEVYTDATGEKYEADQVETDGDGPHVMDRQVIYEEVCEDHVSYDDFLTAPVREWSENPWVARKVAMTRDELKARKFKDWERIPLDWKPITDRDDETDDGGSNTKVKKALIYELWHKPSAKVVWFSKSYPTVLDVRDDPLGLQDFFPCPAPLCATQDLNSIVPIPDYVFYQDQAEELDELTARIGKLQDALRMVGFYSGEENVQLQRVFSAGNENKLIPIEGWAQFKEGGGSKGIIDWIPIDMVVQTLTACYESRQRIIADIYQITGISDIMRGETDPDETAKAQSLKANFGSLRVRDRQKAVAQFARDVIKLKGEVIAAKFSADTLKAMTNVKMFDTVAEKQQVQQQADQMKAMASQPPQPGMPPPAPLPPMPPEMETMLGRPTWEEVDGLLKDKPMRQFRIEIESDSTIEPNDQEQKAAAVEFITAVGTYLGTILPVVQAAPQMVPVAMEGLKWLARRYRIGRDMEETIDRAADEIMQAAQNPQAGPPPDPAEAAKAQAAMQANAIKQQDLQLRAQQGEQDAALQQAQLQTEQQRSAADVEIARVQAETERLNHELEVQRLMIEQDLRQQEIDKPDPKPAPVKK